MVDFNHRYLIKLLINYENQINSKLFEFQQINHNYELGCIINKLRHLNLLSIYCRSIKNSRFNNKKRKYLI